MTDSVMPLTSELKRKLLKKAAVGLMAYLLTIKLQYGREAAA